MTEYGLPFEGVLIGDAATIAPYSSLEWARAWRLQQGGGASFPNYGVLIGSGDGTHQPLEVDATAVISANVQVQVGAASVNGRFYETTAVLTLSVGANASGNPRIDTVVLRCDFVAQTIRAVIKQGTPAGSPVAPTLQQDTLVWELPLADIAVANGFATLAQSTITNRQRYINTQGAGWQSVANPPGYYIAANYDAANIPMSVGGSGLVSMIAVPFLLTGNMLIDDVQVRNITIVLASYIIDWGIYTQDTNEGLTAEHVIRLVASGGATGSTAGTATISLPATPKPQILTPGVKWLVMRYLGGSTPGLQLGAIAGVNFDSINCWTSTALASAPTPQTIDLTGFSPLASSVAIRLRGRVWGKTTVP